MKTRVVGRFHLVVGENFANIHLTKRCDGPSEKCPNWVALTYGSTWHVWPWRSLIRCVELAVRGALKETAEAEEHERAVEVALEVADEAAELVLDSVNA
jgi:hypothetical protein